MIPAALTGCFGVGGGGPDAGPAERATSTAEAPLTPGEGTSVRRPARPPSAPVRAACSLRAFTLVLDRGAAVAALLDPGGGIVASASRESQILSSSACPRKLARAKNYADAVQPRAIYASAGVSCATPRAVDVDVYPVVLGTGERAGTALVVSLHALPTLVASALVIEDVGGRRLYFSPAFCERL